MKKRTLTKRKPKNRKKQKITRKRYTNRKTLKMSIYGSGSGKRTEETRKRDREGKRHKAFINKVVMPFQNEDFDDELINKMIPENEKEIPEYYDNLKIEEDLEKKNKTDKQEKIKNKKGTNELDSFEFDENILE
jgi:hypothetical protein